MKPAHNQKHMQHYHRPWTETFITTLTLATPPTASVQVVQIAHLRDGAMVPAMMSARYFRTEESACPPLEEFGDVSACDQ